MDRIGITTTVPMEVLFSGGKIPVDLNNLFITGENPSARIEEAELCGYPRNVCAWIKGIYGTTILEKIKTVLAVTQGDCSNTHALMETLQLAGVEVIPFAFPFDRDYDLLKLQLEKIIAYLGTSWDKVYEQKRRLDEIRKIISQIDEFTFKDNLVSGFENHLWLINCSDFMGNPEEYAFKAQEFLRETKERKPKNEDIRLAYLGVPPIMDDLYTYLEEKGARVVFNEVQRQFSMPFGVDDLVEQYRLYTYPYGIFYRLEDALLEIEKRKVHGVIHYSQSFCYRQIEDIIVRQKINLPILTLEGDVPNHLDARTKMRIDSFLEMLR